MKLVKASYQILMPINGEEILKAVELAARTCYQSEGKIEYDFYIPGHIPKDHDYYAKSARVLLPKLINNGHHAMLEFGGMITVRFITDRGVSHELVRHRLCSFAQESTRYCNYGKDEHMSFVIPCWSDLEPRNWTIEQMSGSVPNNSAIFRWMWTMIEAEFTYNRMLREGWTPQQARSVLPNSLKTEINMSANLREWREIFRQRTAKAAHPQMRELMIPLLADFKSQIPIIFDDL